MEELVTYYPENDELFSNQASMLDVSPRIIRTGFTGNYLGNDPVKYSWNTWGQLQVTVGNAKIEKQQLQAVLKALYNTHFVSTKETVIGDGIWYMKHGYLTVGKKGKIPGKFLIRGSYIIGFFQEKVKVSRTIKFWNEKVFKYNGPVNIKYQRDFKPEWHPEDDIYADQYPEFTREDELQEIDEFIESISHRK
jgi:hypothetical protein